MMPLISIISTHVDELHIMLVEGKKWITREKAKVDRIACPWLIKNFIDSKPEFLFVPADKVLEVAKTQSAVPFDIPNVELGHHIDRCSFDAIIEKYNLKDPALLELAKIVRAADTNKKEIAAEAIGLEAIAEGFRHITKDDFDNMSKQFYVYDALYAYCKQKIGQKRGGA
jgi:hypothetical protein